MRTACHIGRKVALSASAIVGLLVAAANADSAGILVRPSDRGRVWQVSYAPDEPITWLWPAKATAAQLVVTSHVEKTVRTYDIVRGTGEDLGAWTRPVPAATAANEFLYDLALTFLAGETALRTDAARIAILPESFTVRVPETEAWTKVRDERIVPYDTAWTNEAVSAASLDLAIDGASASVPLAGESGWEPMDLQWRLGSRTGDLSATLSFNDEQFADAALQRVLPGFFFIVR